MQASSHVVFPTDFTVQEEKLKLGFQNVTCTSGKKILLKNAIGAIEPGTVTAVLGPSSSGKSVLLKLLAGRGNQLSNVSVTGDIFVDGRRATGTSHGSYVPQSNDSLNGVLTVREVITYSLRLTDRTGMDGEARKARVNEVISQMALDVCADTKIGTFYMAGISGGQKRRTSVAVEMVHKPSLLIADEPTSGLDTTAAVNVIRNIRASVESDSTSGSIISIHQPNAELLSLFHNIILLVDGETMFCGTLAEAQSHFSNLGISLSGPGTPTELYLSEMDNLFSNDTNDTESGNQDFAAAFYQSDLRKVLEDKVKACDTGRTYQSPGHATSWLVQFSVLLHRAFKVAKRDYALYYLQYCIQLMYGALVGVIFLSTPFVLDDTAQQGFSALVWVTALSVFVFVFKAFYFAEAVTYYQHERANNWYSATASTASELVSFLSLSPGFAAGWLIAVWMIGYPLDAIPFLVLLGFVSVFTAEAVPHFIAQFTGANTSLGLIYTQGFMLVFFMFSAGVFIRDEKLPDGMTWIKDMSPFEHAGDAMMSAIYEHLQYSCATFTAQNTIDMTPTNATCTDTSGGFTFPCDYSVSLTPGNLWCNVKGATVAEIYKGSMPDKWDSLLNLFFVGLGFRIASFILQIFPPVHIVTALTSTFKPSAESVAKNPKSVSDKSIAPLRTSSALTSYILDSGGGGVLEFRNVKVEVTQGMFKKTKKVLLDGISAHVSSGRLMALMGPSGAGKTTLLNALAGMAPYAETSADEVTLNGHQFKKEHLGYVPQFDDLLGSFTAEETLMAAARLRVDASYQELRERVQNLLGTVGLGKLRATKVSKMAGGQQKLLSIAIGLISMPKVLFLDEPTTGLDSTAAQAVVSVVRDIAKTGRLVIMTLHQPSGVVFEMIDDLVVLSRGELAYYGAVEDAPSYFADVGSPLNMDSDESIADQVINAVSDLPGEGNSWSKAFGDSNHAKKQSVSPETAKSDTTRVEVVRPSGISKLFGATKTIFRSYYREPGLYLYRSCANLAFGIFTGLMYLDTAENVENLNEITSIAFLWNWAPLYFALASIPALCISRRQALVAYASDQYSIWQWCLAQFIASIPMNLLAGLCFIIPNHWISHTNTEAETFVYGIMIVWAMGLFMDAVDLNIIEATNSNVMLAVTAGMVILGSLFIFAGFFIKPSRMQPGIAWIPWTIPTKYGLEGVLYSLLHGREYEVNPGEIMEGDEILTSFFDIDIDNFEPFDWINLIIVFAFVVVMRMQHFAFMWKSNHLLGSMAHFGHDNMRVETAKRSTSEIQLNQMTRI